MKYVNKKERIKIFLERLSAEPPAGNEKGACQLLSKTLNEVEDEYTNIPYDIDSWMEDGRMYPPQEDSKNNTDNDKVVRYRNKAHNTYIGHNGAIQIKDIRKKQILLDKPGADGKRIGDL